MKLCCEDYDIVLASIMDCQRVFQVMCRSIVGYDFTSGCFLFQCTNGRCKSKFLYG